MRAIKWAAGVLLVLLLAGFVLPDTVAIERSLVVAAEPRAIHQPLTTLATWPTWSAWNVQADPTVTFWFSGPARGRGARWGWKGEKFSEGTLEIVEDDEDAGLRYLVTMANGFTAGGRIALEPVAGGTRVTWTDTIPLGMGPLGGWMRVFLGGTMDRVQGGNQQASLEGLKRRVELP
jgi:hypothetical protein